MFRVKGGAARVNQASRAARGRDSLLGLLGPACTGGASSGLAPDCPLEDVAHPEGGVAVGWHAGGLVFQDGCAVSVSDDLAILTAEAPQLPLLAFSSGEGAEPGQLHGVAVSEQVLHLALKGHQYVRYHQLAESGLLGETPDEVWFSKDHMFFTPFPPEIVRYY